MLARTLEPEVMDSFEEAVTYDDMNHQPVNRTFVDDLLRFSSLSEVDEVLDLGTGTARIPIALCQLQPTVRVVAADLSHHMLDIARINIEIAAMVDRVLPVRVDAKRLELADGRFGAVISNSLVHHIPDPVTVVREMLRVTAESGGLFVRDLMRPQSLEEIDDLVQTYTGTESDAAQRLFRASLHAALSLDEIRSLVEQLDFPRDTVQPTSDRHWTWATRLTERNHSVSS